MVGVNDKGLLVDVSDLDVEHLMRVVFKLHEVNQPVLEESEYQEDHSQESKGSLFARQEREQRREYHPYGIAQDYQIS